MFELHDTAQCSRTHRAELIAIDQGALLDLTVESVSEGVLVTIRSRPSASVPVASARCGVARFR